MIAHNTPLRVSIYTGKSLEIDLLRRPVAERGFSLIDSFDPLGMRLHGLMLLRNNSVCTLYIDKPYSKGVVSANMRKKLLSQLVVHHPGSTRSLLNVQYLSLKEKALLRKS
jgi:hypothetical protein